MKLSATAFTLKDWDVLQDSSGNIYTVIDDGKRAEYDSSVAMTMLELETIRGQVEILDMSNPNTDLDGIDERIVSFMAATRRDLVDLHRRIEDLENQVSNRLDTLEGF